MILSTGMTDTGERTVDTVLAAIRRFPQDHIHDPVRLVACVTIDGQEHGLLVAAHQEFVRGPNRVCDRTEGPCSCGATHFDKLKPWPPDRPFP